MRATFSDGFLPRGSGFHEIISCLSRPRRALAPPVAASVSSWPLEPLILRRATYMGKQKPKRPQSKPKPKSSLEQEESQVPTFTEIGGSPVPGLTLRHVLRGHKDWIGRIAWSPDGSYLASPSADKTIRIWDAHSGARNHPVGRRLVKTRRRLGADTPADAFGKPRAAVRPRRFRAPRPHACGDLRSRWENYTVDRRE